MIETSPSAYTLKDVISQLELKNLDFETNNIIPIQNLADSLQIDVGLVNLVYQLFVIDSILERDGVDSDLSTLSKKLSRLTNTEKFYVSKSPKATSKNNKSIESIRFECDRMIKMISIKIITIKGKKNGYKDLLDDRFHPSVTKEKIALLNEVLLAEFRLEVQEYLITALSKKRIAILTELLHNNPE
jgi:hypothetical protein